MPERLHFPDETAVLRRFVRQVMMVPASSPPEPIADPSWASAARATYFLLDASERIDVQTFMSYTLYRLLRLLNHRSERHLIDERDRVRGRVSWPATLKARYQRGLDPDLHVCHATRRLHDTPENQLLKYVVERVDQCMRLVPEVIRAGACYFSVAEGLRRPSVATATRLADMEIGISAFRHSIILHEIPTPSAVTDLHVRGVETARLQEYTDLAWIYRRYEAVVLSKTWDELVRIGKRVLPLPGRAEDEGEPWIVFGAAVSRFDTIGASR